MSERNNEIADGDIAGGIAALDDVAADMDAEDGVAPEADDVGEEPDADAAEGDDAGEETDDDEPDADDDQDDDDLDDDLEDDDDEVDDAGAEAEGEGEAQPVTREDGATWDATKNQWRDKSGKFVDGEAPTKEQIAAASAAKPAADAGADKAVWNELSVTVNRKPFVIPEAGVQIRKAADGKEYAFIAVPKEQFPQFTNRIMRGVHAQQVSRELDARLRDVEQLRAEMQEERKLDHPAGATWDLAQAVWKDAAGQIVAGRPPSDAEIEARILLEEIKKKGALSELFEDHEITNMELRQKLAVKEARDNFAKYETGRQTSRTQASEAEQTQVDGVEATVLEIANAFQEFQGLGHDHLVEVFNELLPFKRSVFWREGDEWMKNTQLVYDTLKRKAKSLEAGGTSGAPAPKPAADKAKPGKATAGDRNDRFNEGQRSAARPNKPAKPATTSVKARRDADQRPAGKAATREERRRGKGKRGTREQRAESDHRQKVRKWQNSDSLDFPD